MQTLIVGLTGQSGAGKSTLSRMFSERGAAVVNADLVARETMENSNACRMELVLAFSTEVIHPDATLNREKLAEICFGDRQKLRRLNEITFPYIISEIRGKLDELKSRGETLIILDAPTLFESGLDKDCDRIIAVIADEQTRLSRILVRDEMTEEDAKRRIHAQNEDSFYTERADDVLVNDGDLDGLRIAFLGIYDKLVQMAAGELPLHDPEPSVPEAALPAQEDTQDTEDSEGQEEQEKNDDLQELAQVDED